MTKNKLIIFDFDNCIADTTKVGELVLEELQPIYLKKDIDVKSILYNEGAKSLIKKSGIRKWRIPFIVRRFRKQMTKHFHLAQPYPGMLDVIHTLSKTNKLAILTSNSKHNVENFLLRYNLSTYFVTVKTNVSLFTKSWHIKRIIRKNKISKKDTVMVGDETRDIDAANKVKIMSVAVTWGINSVTLLKDHNPTYIASTPKKLLEKLNLS